MLEAELQNAIDRLEAFNESLIESTCCDVDTTVLTTKMARLISQQIIQIWMVGFGNPDYKVGDDERENLTNLFHFCGASIKNPEYNIRVCTGCLKVSTGTVIRQLRRALAEISIEG